MKRTGNWALAGLVAAGSIWGGLSTSAAAAADTVVVTKAWPDKLVYGFDAPGTCTVTVVATGRALEGQDNAKRAARLKVELLSQLDRAQTLCDQAVELAAAETRQIPIAFRTGRQKDGAEYGYEVRATVAAEGQSNSVAREYFMVTDNPLKIGHLTIPTSMCDSRSPDTGIGTLKHAMERVRGSYFCMCETAFWAPCDFSELTTTREAWTSGQAGRFNDLQGMKAIADGVHAMGGWILIYADKWACGSIGFEHARQQPEWYHWGMDWYGCKFDVDMLDWIAEPTFKDGKWKAHKDGGIWAICPLIGKPEVAEFGIAQITGSMKQFGWDGIRFDNQGWYVEDAKDLVGNRAVKPGTDIPKLEVDLVRQIKAAGRKVKPYFVYGDNVDWFTSLARATPKWRAEAAEGGLVMSEEMNAVTLSGNVLNNWAYLREHLRTSIPTVREAGGYPYGIVGAGDRMWAGESKPGPPDQYLKYATLMASGMHLCYAIAPDYWHYMRLYARYCGLLYDDGLQFVANPDALVSVASPRPVWWKEYVRRRDLTGAKTQFIVHLINPSTGECFDEKNKMPDPQNNIRVALTPPAGIKIQRAFRLTADGRDGPDSLALPVAAEGGKAVVTVPDLMYWDIVVFEGGR